MTPSERLLVGRFLRPTSREMDHFITEWGVGEKRRGVLPPRWGLPKFPLFPRLWAVGCIPAPLCGCCGRPLAWWPGRGVRGQVGMVGQGLVVLSLVASAIFLGSRWST